METQNPASTASDSGIPKRSYFTILPWVVLAISLAATYHLWDLKRQDALRDLQEQFDFRVREAGSEIEHHMQGYQQALRGVQAMFVADATVTHRDFSNYVATLKIQENYPGIERIRYSPIVTRAEKAKHIATMRAEGYGEYTIKPAGERDIYVPVQYIAPVSEGAMRALGYDSYFEATRHAAMDKARDTDEVAISGKLELITETGPNRQAGFLMYLPVYKYGMPHGTLTERRANITGGVAFAFRAQDLIGSILAKKDNEIDLEIFDGEKAAEENILFDSDDGKRKTMPEPDASLFKTTRQITIAGHTWTLQSHSLPALEARIDREKPRVIAVAGIGASMLLTLLAWLLVHGRTLALQSARSMNRELIESKKALSDTLSEMKAITEANPDMMYVVNMKGELIRWSPSLERFLGMTLEQMMNKPATEFVYEEDQPAAMEWMREIFSNGYSTIEARMRSKDGALVSFLCNGVALKNSNGEIIGLTGTGRDITERKRAENLERMRNTVLEMLANDAPLTDILAKIVLWVEEQDARSKCSIVLVNEQSGRISVGAAPSLPDFYKAALEGVLDADDCICSVAAKRGESVVYDNIPEQCSKASSCALAVRGWVAGCWSEPIKSPLGAVLGTLTLYRADTAPSSEGEIQIVEHAATLASMAITNKQIKEELHFASMVLQNSSEGMLVTDADNRIVAVNPAFTGITGYTFDEVKGKNPRMFSSGRHDAAFFRDMWHQIKVTGRWQGEIWDRRKNGEIHANWLTINTIRNLEGQVQRHVALFSDITEKKLSEELIWKQANFDVLTGLPNRRMFLDRLAQEAKKSDRSGALVALLLIDLDQFKEVNDTLGHDMGDILLQEAGRRIRACVRDSDTVARLGGDEFTVILPELHDGSSHIEDIAQKIIAHLAEPFRLGNETAYVSASIGITLYPTDATSIDALMKHADQAMYVAKNRGRNRFSYFTHELQEAAQSRLRLSNDLRNALAASQFRVHFQPIVELASGRIHKAEALIRWQHPVRGTVNPKEFIPLCEETGLIHDLGDWVFREAARWAKQWRQEFTEDFQVSVNMSPVQFRAEGTAFAAGWLGHMQQLGLSGRNIVVEITEGMLLNAEPDILKKLLVFRDAGIQVSIDDFGTGYSSLSYLKKFDIDYLKIDQSFVHGLETDRNDLALCEAIIVMAHKLGLKVIAEGVETEGQRHLLAAAGCDYAQGYLFSGSMSPEELGATAGLGFPLH